MNLWFKVVVFGAGALLLGGIGVRLYHQQATGQGNLNYGASVLDTIAPATEPALLNESTQAVEIEEETQPVVAAVREAISVDTDLPPPPAQSVQTVFQAEAPQVAQSIASPVSAAPISTTPVGFGGTLVNRPAETTEPVPAAEVAVAVETVTIAAPVESPQTAAAASSSGEIVCTTEPPTRVIISELFIDMEGADTEEFVKLYNPGDQEVSLASSSIQYLSGGASSIASLNKKNFSADARIRSKAFYLIGMGGYTGTTTPDMTWSQSLSNTGATVLLVRDQQAVSGSSDPDIIDRVAYGSGTLFLSEHPAAGLPPPGQSLIINPISL
jgi:hypothetical protein